MNALIQGILGRCTMNFLLQWMLGGIGVLCLLGSFKISWLEIPTGVAVEEETLSVSTIEPQSTRFFRLGNLALVGICVAGGWHSRSAPIASLAVAVWCAILLLFPWSVMRQESELSARAVWLDDQHTNLTWLGGDLALAQEKAGHDWKNKIYVVDPPTFEKVPDTPRWNTWESGVEHLPLCLEWAGYSNSFCQFLKKGWLASVVGTLCLFVFVASNRNGIDITRAKKATIGFLVAGSTCFAAILSAEFSAGSKLNQAATEYGRGDFEAAINSLEEARAQSVQVRNSGAVLTQLAILQWQRGESTPLTELLSANLKERAGRNDEAEQIYLRLLNEEQYGWTLQREAGRGLLRAAINKVNSGDNENGARYLETIIDWDPSNLKAIYVLQLTCLRTGDTARLEELVEHCAVVYACFRFPNKRVVLAAGHQNLMLANIREGDTDTAWEHAIKMRHP